MKVIKDVRIFAVGVYRNAIVVGDGAFFFVASGLSFGKNERRKEKSL
jgi:hypothetical protein